MNKVIPLNSEPIKLKINLENMPFSIFRKVLVPSNISMQQLHFVIQIAMGWEDCHLYEFSEKKGRSAIKVQPHLEENEIWGDLESEIFDAEDLTLQEFLGHTDGKSFWYWYDFGDDWWHKVSIQKASKKDISTYKTFPICTEAVGACPPEDIGGPWGFMEFTRKINDKKSSEYEEMREWLGMNLRDKWDFDMVDIEGINEDLESFMKNWE